MHSVLLVVDLETFQPDDLQSFLEECGRVMNKAKVTQRPSENCWLIPLQSELQIFVHLSYAAQKVGGSYKITFFEDEPVWCHVINP